MSKFAICLAGLSFLSLAQQGRAAVYAEIGDAGSTPGTAQTTIGTTALTTITGTITSATDADVFVIKVTTPSSFSATTVNAVTNASNLDTSLFLFTTAGAPIAFNDDDAGGLNFTSTLAAGNTLVGPNKTLSASLTAGTYLLAIASEGNQAVNTNNQLVFPEEPNGTTPTYGAASGLNPAVYSGFNGNVYDAASGAYEIDLTATDPAAVPEPALGLAAVSLAGLLGRRR